jgi:hypothetical protein
MPQENRNVADDATRFHLRSIDASLSALALTTGKLLKLAKIAIALYQILAVFSVLTGVFAVVLSNRAAGGFGRLGNAGNEARLEQLRKAREERGAEHQREDAAEDDDLGHWEEEEHGDEP